MANHDTDIERVERMFTKTLWVVGLIWTITFGGGMFVIFGTITQIRETANSAEKKMQSVANGAEKQIKAAADVAAKDVAAKMSAQIDIEKIISDLKTTRIPEMERRLQDKITETDKRLMAGFQDAESALARHRLEVDRYAAILKQLVAVQDIAKELKVEIRDISLQPNIPKAGKPAQLTARIYAPELKENAVMPIRVQFAVFGQAFELDDQLLGQNELAVSRPFVIPAKIDKDEVPLGAGEYSLTVTVRSHDQNLVLAKQSELITLWE